MAKSEILSEFVLSWESPKYTNRKIDRGGATKYGITLATWKKVGYDKNGDGVINAEDVKMLTKEDYDRVFKKNYWDVCMADKINNQSVANLLVDFAYNSGCSKAIQKIQMAVGTKVDGIMGKNTLAAINGFKQGQWVLFDKLKVARVTFLNDIVKNNPRQEVNLNGWLRRVGNIQYGKLVCNDGRVINCQ